MSSICARSTYLPNLVKDPELMVGGNADGLFAEVDPRAQFG